MQELVDKMESNIKVEGEGQEVVAIATADKMEASEEVVLHEEKA